MTTNEYANNSQNNFENRATPQSQSRRGIFVFPNGDKYDGEYIVTEQGKIQRQGQGKHIGQDGLVYDGQWRNDLMNGRGLLTHDDGSQYDGEFVDNYFQGQGTYSWTDGAKYTGKFVGSKAEGEAEYQGPQLGFVPFIGQANGQEATLRYKITS
ncbi:unnamed protein product [Didymodactylos carnosus]|uniref:Uncharacterized protein n=1 Tax=Didymodactylos carnosus TaxID=1234261 RepID=A0A813P4K7_9BILA|nr:unnamed protein product [Didymodactylos carnosus]CAF0744956.1 unnamed protein product [Didymodactylos carnosus]CAF3493761.1 unnamed protein product [Didymodactylos carnosus]CAF3523626.1 unnamed protein product [Didymodactylos carnosus]